MNLVARVKGILFDPKGEWPVIEREQTDTAALLKGYVAILAAIPAVCGFIGTSIVGVNGIRTPIVYGIISAVGGYVLTFVGVFIVAFVIDALAEKFGGSKNFSNAIKIAVYAPTATWLASAFTILPALSFLAVFGLYSFYLLYTGLPALMKTPQKETMAYFLTVIVAAIIVWVLVLAIPTMLYGGRLF